MPAQLQRPLRQGVCGATIDTIQARNFARMVASGAEAHTDHGMTMLDVFREVVKGKIEDYQIKDPLKLEEVAKEIGNAGVHGLSHEYINYMLGGTFRSSYTPLNDNIINGRIRGVAGVVGCTNPRVKQDWVHVELVK